MNKILVFLVMITALSVSTNSLADATNCFAEDISCHFRLLVHGTSLFEGSNRFGLAGWVIAPDVSSKPNKWLGIFGPRFEERGFHVEAMTGLRIEDGDAVPLLDLRSGINPDFFSSFAKRRLPFALWTNIQWIDVGSQNDLYVYFESNLVLPYGLPAVGAETENIFFLPGPDTASIGGHIVFRLGKMNIVSVYQKHKTGQDQIWLRMVLNF